MVNAIAKEISDRKEYLSEEIRTIYFGGGTPSLLTHDQIQILLKSVKDTFNVSLSAEITLEANPEDLTKSHSQSIHDLGINRLSVGMQTFDDQKLDWMNRIHSSQESLEAIDNVRSAGFSNVSLDLIYAIPDHNSKRWKEDLQRVIDLNPEHISLYGLTIENKTVFGKWERDDKLIQVPEDEAAEQYLYAIEFLKKKGYIQYEVSNFGKEGYYSRHNNAYWSGVPYLGVGPGAHSFDGKSKRRFNIRNNSKYLKAISSGTLHWEEEMLSSNQRINEQILTQLRTKNGIDLLVYKKEIGVDLKVKHQMFLNEMLALDMIELSQQHLRLKPKGFLVADEIALRLFIPE